MSDTTPSTPDNNDNELIESASLRYNLDSLEDYFATSEQVAHEGRLDEAVDVMREAVQRFPESPTGAYNLGVALFLRVKKDREHQEMWEDLADDEQLAAEAISALESALEADPKFVEAYNNLARLYSLTGRKAEAVACWKKSLEIKPDQPEVKSDLELYINNIGPDEHVLDAKRLMDGDKPAAEI